MKLNALAVVVLAFATSVHAADTYDLEVRGESLGHEDAVRTPGEGGATLTSTVSLKFPGAGNGILKQDARFAKDGRPLAYTLDIDAPGQQYVIKGVPAEGGFALSITAKGNATPLKSEQVAASGDVFLLDNNLASHLDVLTRSLGGLAAGATKAITAIVPQVLQAIPGTIERLPDGTARLNGATVATCNYALTIANVREELIAAASDGALLQVTVPLQRFRLSRAGYAPAADEAAAKAADPRETAAAVKSPAGPLPAALVVPRSESLVPGVVFLSGSGPNDKDETIGPNKPFRDLAYGLADRGIASLRMDKRTAVTKDPATLGLVSLATEYYDDAATALALLRATPGVDPKRVFLLGHSEGAMVAPKIAAADKTVRGAILMAPAVRPVDEVIIDQHAQGAKEMGRPDDEIAEQTQVLKSTFAALRDPKRRDAPPFMGAPATYWRELLAVDVAGGVAALKIPVLVLQGDKDFQVRKDLDFDRLKAKAGTAGGRISYRSFPQLNHLFIAVEKESTGAEYALEGHVDAAVIKTAADWILAH
jgi:alpha-beta hydrolase superfamily lysophospholipase